MSGGGIIESTLILTVANIINRIFGFAYRIYMSNVIGAEGMGLYQLIMPLYSLAWSISCSGFTTTVSKLVAGEKAKGDHGNMGRILKQGLVITTFLSVILSLTLFFLSSYAAKTMFNDLRLEIALKILALSFPFMAAGSCIRGYFTGLQEMVIPAISQVFEQTVRMAVVFFLSYSFIPRGIEYACSAAVLGIFAGELLSFIFVIIAYKIFKSGKKFNKKPTISSKQAFIILITMAMPLTMNRIAGSLLGTVENMLLPRKLVEFGMENSQAVSEFGKLTGMAMPLIQFPSALLMALSISLVPAISEAAAVKNLGRIRFTVSKVMLFSGIVGIGASAIFTLFSKELGGVIYNEDLSHILMLLGIMCPFMYLQTTLSGILNGLGEQMFIFRNSMISSFISISVVFFAVPLYGLNAYILGSFTALCLLCTLNLMRIRKISEIKLDVMQWFIKPLLCAVLSALIINLAKSGLSSYFGEKIGLVCGVGITGFVYMGLVVACGCLKIDDFKRR